jgi:hypothetical protein
MTQLKNVPCCFEVVKLLRKYRQLVGQARGSAHASCLLRNVGCTRAATYRWPLRISSPRTIMSTVPSTSTSHSNFVSIFNAALETYKRKTKKDLASHPLLPSLQSCDSPEAILTVLREQIPAFSQSQNGDDGLTKWVTPTVNVLHSFSATLGGGIGLQRFRKLLPRVGFVFFNRKKEKNSKNSKK